MGLLGVAAAPPRETLLSNLLLFVLPLNATSNNNNNNNNNDNNNDNGSLNSFHEVALRLLKLSTILQLVCTYPEGKINKIK